MVKKRLINYVKAFICFSLTFLLASCSVMDWFLGKPSDSEVKEMDDEMSKSIGQHSTPYDNSLREFGKMLDAYNISSIRVQSKIISNQTAEKDLPDNISRMLISAINKIGNRVVYVPYDPSYVINEANTGGNINRALPKIVIAGGITEYDKDMIEKGREAKPEVSIQKGDFGSNYNHDGGAGYQAEGGISRITVDLQLLDYSSQAYLSGIQAINTINIRKSKLALGIGYFFQGSGMSVQYSLSKKQGKYYALRLLVELSVIEVLGKYFDVPYWECIKGMAPDNGMVARMRDEFEMLPLNKQYSYLKEYLYFHGISGFNRESPLMDSAELAKLESVMKKYNVNNNTDLFIKLWETVPLNKARERNKTYAQELARQKRKAQIQRQKSINAYNEAITRADNLYSAKDLKAARKIYEEAARILPNQQDPLIMIQKIDQEMAAKNVAPVAKKTAAVPAPEEKSPSVKKEPPKKKGKEAPLNPFKKVEW